ncbi:hypothetical protein OHC50_16195 [Paenarthrobacter ilicis]|uniref:hypothetical protein n=1 Tax=Paenarthrobacter ilicis TaxID=43665 RepID=UPI00300BB0DF
MAVILAIGGNLVASYLWDTWGAGISLAVGCAAVVLVLIIVIAAELRHLSEDVCIDGALLIYEKKLLEIPGYKLSETMAEAFEATINENEAIRHQWQTNELTSDTSAEAKSHPASRLVHELTEFALLSKLSRHLEAAGLLNEDQVRVFERKDLLPLLPQNRVLDLLSSPIEDRMALVSARDQKEDRNFWQIHRVSPGGKQVLVQAGDGTYLFKHLELSLPVGATPARVGLGEIHIESKYVTTTLKVGFNGISTVFDRMFLERYMKLPLEAFRSETAHIWNIRIEVAVRIKWRSLLSSKAWKQYKWSEDFVESCRRDFGREEFLESIAWSQVKTQLITEHARSQPAQASTSDRTTDQVDDEGQTTSQG